MTIWISIGIVLSILEIFTPGFILACFGIASIFTSVSAWLNLSIYWQLSTFIVLTFLTLKFIRPFAVKKLYNFTDEYKTNVSSLIGREGTVSKRIEEGGLGRVKVGGEDWLAISDGDKKVDVGAKVEVIKVEGTKLYVKNK